MNRGLLDFLCCPVTGKPLQLKETEEAAGEIWSGVLYTPDGESEYPIVEGIPRFVSPDNYAGNFGFQWNKFRQTQLDSTTGVLLSYDRFYKSTEWSPDELRGKKVLEVGCGAGRFTEVVLASGASVVSVDYSSAVTACWQNHKPNPSLDILQGDIYHLPIKPETFDYVYCLGVLQHTPDPKNAFAALTGPLRRGGKISVDIYRKRKLTVFWSKYWIRPFTKRMDPERLFRLVEKVVPLLLPISILVGRVPLLGRKLRYLIPVANYDGIFPLSRDQLHQWAVLDTFDMLSPTHDHPQSASRLFSWFEEVGLKNIKVFKPAHLVGNAVKEE